MPRTRIRCPMCGALAYESTFEKGPYPLRAMAMKGKGRGRGFLFSKVVNLDFLYRMRDYLIERTKALYKHLTGIDIDELEGGELERLKLRSALINPVSTSTSLRMEPPLSKRKTSVTLTGNPVKTLTNNTKRLQEKRQAQSLSQNPCSKISKKVPTYQLVD